MAILRNGVKYACIACQGGHRVRACKHDDKPLFPCAQPGRPPAGTRQYCDCPKVCTCRATKAGACKCKPKECYCTRIGTYYVSVQITLGGQCESEGTPVTTDWHGNPLSPEQVEEFRQKKIQLHRGNSNTQATRFLSATTPAATSSSSTPEDLFSFTATPATTISNTDGSVTPGHLSSSAATPSTCCSSTIVPPIRPNCPIPPETGAEAFDNNLLENTYLPVPAPSSCGKKAAIESSATAGHCGQGEPKSGACSCGPGCTCAFCHQHPYNKTSQYLAQRYADRNTPYGHDIYSNLDGGRMHNLDQLWAEHPLQQALPVEVNSPAYYTLADPQTQSCMGATPRYAIASTQNPSEQELNRMFGQSDPTARTYTFTYPVTRTDPGYSQAQQQLQNQNFQPANVMSQPGAQNTTFAGQLVQHTQQLNPNLQPANDTLMYTDQDTSFARHLSQQPQHLDQALQSANTTSAPKNQNMAFATNLQQQAQMLDGNFHPASHTSVSHGQSTTSTPHFYQQSQQPNPNFHTASDRFVTENPRPIFTPPNPHQFFSDQDSPPSDDFAFANGNFRSPHENGDGNGNGDGIENDAFMMNPDYGEEFFDYNRLQTDNGLYGSA